MPFFSRFGGGKKDKKKKSKEEGMANKAEPPKPYRHVPTHAYSDSILMCGAGSAEENREAIRKATSRRESMLSSSRTSYSRPSYSRTSSTNNMEYSRTPSYYSLPNSPVNPRESAAMALSMSMPSTALPRSRSHLSTVMTAPNDPSPSNWAPRVGNPRPRPQQPAVPQLQQDPRPPHRHSARTYQSLVVPDDAEFQFPFQETRGSSSTPSSTSSSTAPSSLESSPIEMAVKTTDAKHNSFTLSSPVHPVDMSSHADHHLHHDHRRNQPLVETETEHERERDLVPVVHASIESPSIIPEPDFSASANASFGEAVFLDDAGRVFAVPTAPAVPSRKPRPSISSSINDRGVGSATVHVGELRMQAVN